MYPLVPKNRGDRIHHLEWNRIIKTIKEYVNARSLNWIPTAKSQYGSNTIPGPTDIPPYSVFTVDPLGTTSTGLGAPVLDLKYANGDEGLLFTNGPYTIPGNTGAGLIYPITQWDPVLLQSDSGVSKGDIIGMPLTGASSFTPSNTTDSGLQFIALTDPDASDIVWAQRTAYCTYKKIKFELTSALTTASSQAFATIESEFDFGFNNPNVGTGAITVNNFLDNTDAAYVFSGAIGNKGIAIWRGDHRAYYEIIQMECP